MSVAGTSNRVDYTADGIQTAFAFSFPVYTTADLQVYTTAPGAAPVLAVISTNYTQSAVNVPGGIVGGTVTFNTAPTNGYQVTLIRVLPVTQPTSFSNFDKFDAKTAIEGAFDKVVMIAQQVNEANSRSMVAPVDENTTLTLPSKTSRENKYLGFDGSGNPAALDAPTSTSITTVFSTSLLADASAAAARSTLNTEMAAWVGTVGGTGDAITLTPTEPIAAYAAGQRFVFQAAHANTTTVTVAVSGLAPQTLQKVGHAGATVLAAGDIIALQIVEIVYDGSNFNLVAPNHSQEVTWTPSVGGTATYTSRQGRANRNGMMVHLSCTMTINAIGTGSAVQITGVPYAAYDTATAPVYFNSAASSVITVVAVLVASTISLYSIAAAGTTMDTSHNILGNGTTIYFSMDYMTQAG